MDKKKRYDYDHSPALQKTEKQIREEIREEAVRRGYGEQSDGAFLGFTLVCAILAIVIMVAK